MNIQVSTDYIKHAGEEIYMMLQQMEKIWSEIEDIENCLLRQTEFRPYIKALRNIQDNVMQERYKLSMLAQALVNISNLYYRTEDRIEENFELQKHENGRVEITKIDLTELGNRMNRLLYGGDGGWQV